MEFWPKSGENFKTRHFGIHSAIKKCSDATEDFKARLDLMHFALRGIDFHNFWRQQYKTELSFNLHKQVRIGKLNTHWTGQRQKLHNASKKIITSTNAQPTDNHIGVNIPLLTNSPPAKP